MNIPASETCLALDFVLQFVNPKQLPMSFVYTNHRGETGRRIVRALGFRYGASDYHKGDNLMLVGYDIIKEGEREYPLTDIDITTLTVALDYIDE